MAVPPRCYWRVSMPPESLRFTAKPVFVARLRVGDEEPKEDAFRYRACWRSSRMARSLAAFNLL